MTQQRPPHFKSGRSTSASGAPGRPASGKPASGRPAFGKPAGKPAGHAHAGQDDRPKFGSSERPAGRGPKLSLASGDSGFRKREDDRPPGRAQQERPPGRAQQERPPGRTQQERPPGRSQQERPQGRPEQERPAGRPQQERPQQERPQGRPKPERHSQNRDQNHGQDRKPSRSEPRAPAVPNGAVWLYGIHAVGAALANPARRLRRLVITEEADVSLTAELPKPWPIQPEIGSRERIDQLLGAGRGTGIVHQGVALLTDQLTAPPLADALKRPGPILVLDQISDPRNIGALMRTAHAFGAAAVITQERNAPEETGALAKAASGALELIPLLRIVNIARALIVLKAANVWVVGLDGASPTQLNGAGFAARRVALVLGSEGEGMRRLTRESCDEIAALAMPGGMESLNVSAAGAVALYELTRPAG